MKCNLCKINEADKTGSHFLTLSFIKTAINEAGRGERDREIVFKLTSGKDLDIEPYFGRKILPEAIDKVLNSEVKFDDFIKNHNPFVEDYLFCTECENRFAIIEGYFISNLYLKIKSNLLETERDSKGNRVIKIDSQKGLLTRLFFYVQLWRTSISKHSFKLDEKIENSLRKIIFNCLEKNIDATLDKCKENKLEILSHPLTVTYWETEIHTENKFENTTNLIYFHDKSKRPYFVIINDFVIRLYRNKRHLNTTPNHFFGFTDLIDTTEHINIDQDEFTIGVLVDSHRRKILDGVIGQPVEMFFKNWKKRIKEFHIQIFGFTPTEYVLKGILLEIIYSDEITLDKYNSEYVIKVISKVFYELSQKGEYDFKFFEKTI